MVSKISRLQEGQGAGEPQANFSVAGEEDPGALPGSVDAGVPGQARVELTDAELVQLQLRVIARFPEHKP
jgi:hypothetical protein